MTNPNWLPTPAALLGATLLLLATPLAARPRISSADDPATGPAAITPEQQFQHASARVAAVQMTGKWIYDINDADNPTVDEVIPYIERAAADKADLIVFPELLLGRFPVPHPITDRIGAAAARHRINVIVGAFEVIDEAGNFGNSILVFDRAGRIVGRYFKTHPAVGEPPYLYPPRPEDPEYLMTPGPGFPVFDLDFARIGIFTCYDGYFPEPARILSLKGAELLIWPSAHPGVVEDYMVKATMNYNKTNLVATNKAFGAGTCIAQWPETIVASIPEREEGYIVADLDFAHLRHTRKHAREFRQRRPEIYTGIAERLRPWERYANLPEPPYAPGPYLQLEGIRVETPRRRAQASHEGEDLSRLGLRIRADWLEGFVELRMPEVLISSMGTHFMDHFLSSLEPLHEWATFPQWERDELTGEISYRFTTPEGLELYARAWPGRDYVDLRFHVTNGTTRTLWGVEPNCCFSMNGSADFNKRWDPTRILAWYGGKLQDLTAATPTPEQTGRPLWVAMATTAKPDDLPMPEQSGHGMWFLEQTAEENLMAVLSDDGAYLIGYAWDAMPYFIMSNAGNPCLHTGPAPSGELKPGEAVSRYGRIYMMENDPDALVARYREDKQRWGWRKR